MVLPVLYLKLMPLMHSSSWLVVVGTICPPGHMQKEYTPLPASLSAFWLCPLLSPGSLSPAFRLLPCRLLPPLPFARLEESSSALSEVLALALDSRRSWLCLSASIPARKKLTGTSCHVTRGDSSQDNGEVLCCLGNATPTLTAVNGQMLHAGSFAGKMERIM